MYEFTGNMGSAAVVFVVCCRSVFLSYALLSLSPVIVLDFLGWFDLNKFTVQCSACKTCNPSWSLRDVVHAGYWPGSPTDTSYVFDQQLFYLWDSLQKRMPGTSETSFVKALEDVSVLKGRVSFKHVKINLILFCNVTLKLNKEIDIKS